MLVKYWLTSDLPLPLHRFQWKTGLITGFCGKRRPSSGEKKEVSRLLNPLLTGRKRPELLIFIVGKRWRQPSKETQMAAVSRGHPQSQHHHVVLIFLGVDGGGMNLHQQGID
jgi:hypothetical protein